MRKNRPRGKSKIHCSKCDKLLEESRKNKYRYCKSCHAEYMRNTRPKHKQLTDEQRKKANARSYVKEYIKRGTVIKLPCSVCGDEKSEAHHEDYDKPLEVIWYCRKHHLEYHKKHKTA